jgi:hypothetical protein
MNKRTGVLLPVAFLALAGAVLAQRFGGLRFGGGRGFGADVRTAREIPSGSTGTPEWVNPVGFEKDVFTFARVRYGQGGGFGRGGSWQTDTPDSDLNFSYRLQQMTSMKVDPDGRFVNLTDPDLSHFPFIYIVEPGRLYFSDEEAAILRKYLLNGGCLMLDDFWGEDAWANMASQIRKALPEREFVELPLDHPIYHCVFDIRSKGQVPNIGLGTASQSDPEHRTWEREDAQTVHHRAIFDDKGRIMVIATHNTDNGDGWEREGENHFYFENFSEKIAYPLGINIVFYAMSH